jgi:hypothetical protein
MSSDFSFDVAELSFEYDTLTGARVNVGESANAQVDPSGATEVQIGQVIDAAADPTDGVSVNFGGEMTDVSVGLTEGVSVGVGDIVGVETGSNGTPEVTVFGMDVVDTLSNSVNISDFL